MSQLWFEVEAAHLMDNVSVDCVDMWIGFEKLFARTFGWRFDAESDVPFDEVEQGCAS